MLLLKNKHAFNWHIQWISSGIIRNVRTSMDNVLWSVVSWEHSFFGGAKVRILQQRDIFPTIFNWKYNGLQRPNMFELSSFRSAITVSKYRSTLFWTRFVLGVKLKRCRRKRKKNRGKFFMPIPLDCWKCHF